MSDTPNAPVLQRASETTAELSAKIDASIERIGLRPTVDRVCWDAIGRCAASLQRPLSLDEAAAVYAAAWHLVIDGREHPSTVCEQTTRFASLLKASLDWNNPRSIDEAVH